MDEPNFTALRDSPAFLGVDMTLGEIVDKAIDNLPKVIHVSVRPRVDVRDQAYYEANLRHLNVERSPGRPTHLYYEGTI